MINKQHNKQKAATKGLIKFIKHSHKGVFVKPGLWTGLDWAGEFIITVN